MTDIMSEEKTKTNQKPETHARAWGMSAHNRQAQRDARNYLRELVLENSTTHNSKVGTVTPGSGNK